MVEKRINNIDASEQSDHCLYFDYTLSDMLKSLEWSENIFAVQSNNNASAQSDCDIIKIISIYWPCLPHIPLPIANNCSVFWRLPVCSGDSKKHI